jgi:hypothetical protein
LNWSKSTTFHTVAPFAGALVWTLGAGCRCRLEREAGMLVETLDGLRPAIFANQEVVCRQAVYRRAILVRDDDIQHYDMRFGTDRRRCRRRLRRRIPLREGG